MQSSCKAICWWKRWILPCGWFETLLKSLSCYNLLYYTTIQKPDTWSIKYSLRPIPAFIKLWPFSTAHELVTRIKFKKNHEKKNETNERGCFSEISWSMVNSRRFFYYYFFLNFSSSQSLHLQRACSHFVVPPLHSTSPWRVERNSKDADRLIK
jgi:hypothetical protein